MGIFLIIVGIILIIVGIVGFFKIKSAKERLAQLGGSSEHKLGELVPILMQTKAEMSDLGTENVISENVTVMGQPQCQNPLRAPISGTPCIYYTYKVVYKTTERYQETDANGNTEWKTRTHEQTLDQGTNSTPFALNDGTGSIMVNPDKGKFEGIFKSVDKTETNFQRNANNNVQLGNLMVSLANLGTAVANAVATSNMNNAMMNNNMGMNNGMMNNNMGMNNMGGMNNGMMNNMGGMNNGMMNNGMGGMNNGMMNNGMNGMNNGMMNNGMNGMNNGMMNNGMNGMNNGMMNNNMNGMNNGMMNNMNNNNMSGMA